MTVCFCTLAIHAPYRRRARLLCAEATTVPWIVLTDEPDDFADLDVRAIRHAPTGPMAVDYLARLPPTGEGRGAAAYHDKRFALLAALQDFDTAIYVDADCRIAGLPPLGVFPFGLAVLPVVRRSIAEHLNTSPTLRSAAATRVHSDHTEGLAAPLDDFTQRAQTSTAIFGIGSPRYRAFRSFWNSILERLAASEYSPVLEPRLNEAPVVWNDIQHRLEDAFDSRKWHLAEPNQSFL